jgi:outer membrane protein
MCVHALRKRLIGSNPFRLPLGVLALAAAFLSAGTPARGTPTADGSAPPVPLPALAAPVAPPSGATADSLSLTQAIQLALDQNVATRTAAEQRTEAQARLREALAPLLPNVSAAASQASTTTNLAAIGFQKGFIPGMTSTFLGPYDTFDARLYLVQSVFNFGSIRRYQAGKAGAELADLADRLAREQVAAGTALAYITARREEMAVGAAQADLDLARRLLELARSQHDAGVATGLDVTRAQTRVAQEEVRLAQVRNADTKARLQLLRLTGLALNSRPVLTDPLRPSTAPPPPVDEAVNQALQGRYEVRIAAVEVKQADLLRGAAKGDLLPSVDVVGNYGASGVHIDENDLPTRSIALRLNIPVFDGGASWARVAAADSRLRQAKLQLEDIRAQVEEDIRLAVDLLATSTEQVHSADQSLGLAGQELTQAQDRFAAGVSDNIEVLSAQTALENARLAQVLALAQLNAARVNLATALGQAESFSW